MGTLGVLAPHSAPPTHPATPLAALGLAKPSRALAEPRRVAAEGREGQGGLVVVPSADKVGGQSPAPPTRCDGNPGARGDSIARQKNVKPRYATGHERNRPDRHLRDPGSSGGRARRRQDAFWQRGHRAVFLRRPLPPRPPGGRLRAPPLPRRHGDRVPLRDPLDARPHAALPPTRQPASSGVRAHGRGSRRGGFRAHFPHRFGLAPRYHRGLAVLGRRRPFADFAGHRRPQWRDHERHLQHRLQSRHHAGAGMGGAGAARYRPQPDPVPRHARQRLPLQPALHRAPHHHHPLLDSRFSISSSTARRCAPSSTGCPRSSTTKTRSSSPSWARSAAPSCSAPAPPACCRAWSRAWPG